MLRAELLELLLLRAQPGWLSLQPSSCPPSVLSSSSAPMHALQSTHSCMATTPSRCRPCPGCRRSPLVQRRCSRLH